MGNKLERSNSLEGKYGRPEISNSRHRQPVIRSFVQRPHANDPSVTSLQNLLQTRQTPAELHRYSSAPRKVPARVDTRAASSYSVERFRRKCDKFEWKEVDQAVAFSRYFVESFFQTTLNPPVNHSALFPPSPLFQRQNSRSGLPGRLQGLGAIGRRQSDQPGNSLMLEPEKQEFQLLFESLQIKRQGVMSRPSKTVPESYPPEKVGQGSRPVIQRTRNVVPHEQSAESLYTQDRQAAKQMPTQSTLSISSQSGQKLGSNKVSAHFLMHEASSGELPINALLSHPNPQKQRSHHFSSNQNYNHSTNRSGEHSFEDSAKKNQFSNEKFGRAYGKSPSTFNISDGHVFSFQKEINGLSKPPNSYKAVQENVIQEESHDGYEDESLAFNSHANRPGNGGALMRKRSSTSLLPAPGQGHQQPRVGGSKQANVYQDSLGDEYGHESSREYDLDETLGKITGSNSKKSLKLKEEPPGQKASLVAVGQNFAKFPSRSSFNDFMKNNRPAKDGDRPRQIILDLQSLAKKGSKAELKDPVSVNLVQNAKFPSSSKNSFGVSLSKKESSGSNFETGQKPDLDQPFIQKLSVMRLQTTAEDKQRANQAEPPRANSIKNLFGNKRSQPALETSKPDPRPSSVSGSLKPANPIATHIKTIPKVLDLQPKEPGSSGKTYAGLFLTKKSDGRTPMPPFPSPTPALQSKKELIIENSNKLVKQIREETGHRRDFSGFSHVRVADTTQELESESVEYKLFENILGDLQQPPAEPEGAYLSSGAKQLRVSHSSKESSKHNVQIDIGNLSKKVQINFDQCFKKR